MKDTIGNLRFFMTQIYNLFHSFNTDELNV